MALLTSSGSLRLAVNGKRSLSKLKLDMENERSLCRAEGAIPSSSSRALKESSESLEDLDGSENSCGGRGSAFWPLGDKLIEKAISKETFRFCLTLVHIFILLFKYNFPPLTPILMLKQSYMLRISTIVCLSGIPTLSCREGPGRRSDGYRSNDLDIAVDSKFDPVGWRINK